MAGRPRCAICQTPVDDHGGWFHEVKERKADMDFSQALIELRLGGHISREGWNGSGMWLALQVPDEFSKMTRPYIFMKTADDQLVPWVASQTDILATDWEEVG